MEPKRGSSKMVILKILTSTVRTKTTEELVSNISFHTHRSCVDFEDIRSSLKTDKEDSHVYIKYVTPL